MWKHLHQVLYDNKKQLHKMLIFFLFLSAHNWVEIAVSGIIEGDMILLEAKTPITDSLESGNKGKGRKPKMQIQELKEIQQFGGHSK